MLRLMKWLAVLGAALALAGSGAAATPAETWTGTFRLGAVSDPVIVSVDLARGVVVLGPSHAPLSRTTIRRDGARIRFSVPGRPALAFDGRLAGKRIAGTVRQGAARGTFSLARGPLSEQRALGVYRLASGKTLGVFGADGPRIGVVFEDDELRGLFRTGAGRYDLGSGWGARGTPVGTAALDGSGGTWRGEKVERLPVRTLEVRFGTLAGTLWIPAGAGKHAAVAIAHGSGVTPRQFAGPLPAYFASRGLVVLAYDKRGTGQSAGPYPGEAATTRNVDLYARDAAAAVRFLAAQPEVDRAKVGLAGQSQAGWVMALAAARESAVRWFFSVLGPGDDAGRNGRVGPARRAGRSAGRHGRRDRGADPPARAQRLRPAPVAAQALNPAPLSLRRQRPPHPGESLSVERLDGLGGDLKVVLLPKADRSTS